MHDVLYIALHIGAVTIMLDVYTLISILYGSLSGPRLPPPRGEGLDTCLQASCRRLQEFLQTNQIADQRQRHVLVNSSTKLIAYCVYEQVVELGYSSLVASISY